MKTSRLLLAALLLLTGMYSNAQMQKEPLRLGVSVNPGIALNSPTGFVLGGDLRLQQGIGNSVSLIATTGYTHFFKTTQNNITTFGGAGFIPLKAGIKVFPAKNFYVAGELGAGFGTENGIGTSFVYSPSVGVIVGRDWDLSVKYEDFTKYSVTQQLALRVAYGFKL